MIKVKMITLLNSTEALQNLAKKDLKARLALRVSKLLKAADTEIQSFNDARMNLIQKYGEKDSNNELIKDEEGNCKIPESNTSTFTNELNELVAEEVEINVNKIKLEDIEDLEFTPLEMSLLEDFIEDEEKEETIE